MGIDPPRVAAIGSVMRRYGVTMIAWQRRADKLAEARRIADQWLALGSRLVRVAPDQASSYMVLSEACVQKAKIAYRQDSREVIERWERSALEAAFQAAIRDPENPEVHSLIRNRLERLHKLLSGPH